MHAHSTYCGEMGHVSVEKRLSDISSCFDGVDGHRCIFPAPDLKSVLVIIKLSQLCHEPDQGPNVPPSAVNEDKLVHNYG